jgi:hypothetical protein
MKTSVKVILIAATVGVLGMAGLAKAVNASQNRSLNAVVPQHSSMMNDKKPEIAEKSDGDRETNDDVEESQEASKLQSLAKITPQQAQQSAEAANQGAKASEVVRQKSLSMQAMARFSVVMRVKRMRAIVLAVAFKCLSPVSVMAMEKPTMMVRLELRDPDILNV